MSKSHVLLAAIALCACLSSACAVQTPGVTAEDVELSGLSFTALALVVDLNLTNPNEFALPLGEMNWALDIAQKPLADGKVDINEEIAAKDSARIEVPLQVSYQRAASTITKVLQGRSIPYSIEGDIGFDTPVGVISVPFESAGRWSNPLRSSAEEPAPVRVSAVIPKL